MQFRPFLVPDLPEITELRHTNKIDLIYSCIVNKVVTKNARLKYIFISLHFCY